MERIEGTGDTSKECLTKRNFLDPRRAFAILLSSTSSRNYGSVSHEEQGITTREKIAIVEQLPENLVQILQERLRSIGILHVQLDEEGDPLFASTEEREKIKAELFGGVFELLAKEEYFESVGGDTREDKETSKKFLGILQNPARYGLRTRRGRNPDMLKVQNGVITGIYEIKSGPLDERAYSQFNGFRGYIKDVLRELRYLQDKKPEGLAQRGISRDVAKLKLSEESNGAVSGTPGHSPKIWLIVPYGWEQGMSKNTAYSAGIAKMSEMFESEEVGIMHSIFTREDVGKFSDILFLEVVRGLGSQIE